MGYVTVPKGQKPSASDVTSPKRRSPSPPPRRGSGATPSFYKGGGPLNPTVPLQNLGSGMLNRTARGLYGKAGVEATKDLDVIEKDVETLSHPAAPLALGPGSGGGGLAHTKSGPPRIPPGIGPAPRPHGGPGWASGPTYGRPPGVLSNTPPHHDEHHDYDLGNKHVSKDGAIDTTSTVRPRSKAQQAKREAERHPPNPPAVWESRDSTEKSRPIPASSAGHMIVDTTAYEPIEGRSRTSNRPPPEM